jgi:predicted dehydrogenase
VNARSDRVGVAIVGTGFGARVQLPVFAHLAGARVLAVVGRDRERTRRLASEYGVQTATTTLAAVLDDPHVQLVCVATPPDLHLEHAAAALAAGKHVVCEKPLATSSANAEALCDVARQSPRLALVDHQLRFAPAVRRLQRLLSDGYIGATLYAHVDVATDRELRPGTPHSWWNERRRGGGAWGAYGSHAIDLTHLLCGDIEAVCGLLHTFIDDRPLPGELRRQSSDADDWAHAWLRCGPVRVAMQLSAVAAGGAGLQLALFGTDGMLQLDREGALRGRHAGGGLEDLAPAPELPGALRGRIPDSPWTSAFALFAAELINAIAAGSSQLPGAATFADGLRVQRVLDAARVSSDGGSGWVATAPPGTLAAGSNPP